VRTDKVHYWNLFDDTGLMNLFQLFRHVLYTAPLLARVEIEPV